MTARPIRQWVEGIVRGDLSPDAQRRAAATFARQKLAEALAHNRRVTGRDVAYEQIVDGSRGASLERVNPDGGRIIFRFDVADDAIFEWIAEILSTHSPIVTGEYERSHRFFAGGREIPEGAQVPRADEYVFLNVAPYARKLESQGAGVYEAVAVLARRRFGDVADVKFSFRAASEFGIVPYQPIGRRHARNRGKGGRFVATPAGSAETRAAASAEREARVPAIVVVIRNQGGRRGGPV